MCGSRALACFVVYVLTAIVPSFGQSTGNELFEKTIRPTLVTKCYMCHSSQLKSPMSGLVVDTKAGLLKGGARGPEIIPGKPADSRLLQALRYTDPQLQMPPTGKLDDKVIADFEQWIAAGAPDPRQDPTGTAASPAPLKGMSIEEGRKWWAFQPVREIQAPKVRAPDWPGTKIDSFLLAKLEEKGLKPSQPADSRTLIRRAYIDLTGLKPTYEEVEDFASDSSPNAYSKMIDRLLASPRYGERWGRYWLDVARFGEDFGEPPFPYAWRYRDWVIEALNADVPYDRFVKLQLSADLMPGTPRSDLRALGYLGTGPSYHKDARLSRDVILGFATDDWDGEIDAVSRGLLGLTVSCARCHDHKFDPITTKDYYALAGVFASTSAAERPVFDVDPQTDARFMWVQDRLWELDLRVRYLTELPGTKPDESAKKVEKWLAEMEQLKAEMAALKDRYPQLGRHVAAYGTNLPKPRISKPNNLNQPREDPKEPFMDTVYDAALYVDGTDPDITMLIRKPGEAQDLPVFLHGNVNAPGEPAPRRFLSVLSKNPDEMFRKGSGRLELGERIFTDAAPLTARVIVNRVWGWHFGRPLVATPSDLGTQGDKPSNPELLDDLAARFIAHGWSLKWLHREIMLSAAYRQSSKPRPDAERADQTNSLLWRMSPRRLDIEAYRDSILEAAGTLDDTMYGPSLNLDAEGNSRRTVYGRVSRTNLNTLLRLYDFPDPIQTSSGRDLTITSLQQLFVMNSGFIQKQAAALAQAAEKELDQTARLRSLYRKVLGRDPDTAEIDLAMSYLNHATLAQYAQVLLSTNEEIFWP